LSRPCLAPFAAGLLTLMAFAGCEVDHRNEMREYTGPAASTQTDLLAVNVRFPAGGVRLHAGRDGLLYRARITHCLAHTKESVTLSDHAEAALTASGGTLRRLDVSLSARPGGPMGFGGESNVLRLDLAAGVPQVIDMNLGEGESVIDLSGIRLRDFHLTAGAGDTRVIFAEPNVENAGRVAIEGTVGDIGVDLLGNANAAVTVVRGGVGGIEVDMTGAWRRSASVEIDASVGDVQLKLPRNFGVRLEVGPPWRERVRLPGYARVGDVFLNEAYQRAEVALDVRVLPGIGRLNIVIE